MQGFHMADCCDWSAREILINLQCGLPVCLTSELVSSNNPLGSIKVLPMEQTFFIQDSPWAFL